MRKSFAALLVLMSLILVVSSPCWAYTVEQLNYLIRLYEPQLEQRQQTLITLQRERASLRLQRQFLRMQLDHARADLRWLESQPSTDPPTQETRMRLAEAKARIYYLEQRIQQLSAEISDLNELIARLEWEIAELTALIASLKRQLQAAFWAG